MIAPCEDLMLIVCAPAMGSEAVATVHHHLETRSFPISNSMLLWTAPTPLDGKYVALLTESVFLKIPPCEDLMLIVCVCAPAMGAEAVAIAHHFTGSLQLPTVTVPE